MGNKLNRKIITLKYRYRKLGIGFCTEWRVCTMLIEQHILSLGYVEGTHLLYVVKGATEVNPSTLKIATRSEIAKLSRPSNTGVVGIHQRNNGTYQVKTDEGYRTCRTLEAACAILYGKDVE